MRLAGDRSAEVVVMPVDYSKFDKIVDSDDEEPKKAAAKNAVAPRQADRGGGAALPTAAEILKDYKHKAAVWEEHKKHLKAKGLEWRCCRCRQELPPELYGARGDRPEEVHRLCMTPGHCRSCLDCRQGPSGKEEGASTVRCCSRCQQERDIRHFRLDRERCVACERKENPGRYLAAMVQRPWIDTEDTGAWHTPAEENDTAAEAEQDAFLLEEWRRVVDDSLQRSRRDVNELSEDMLR